jgi:DNA-directed RNA polymerase specialized sigma subunit
MSTKSKIPTGDIQFSDEDFATAKQRFDAVRARLLENTRAAEAAHALTTQIDARVGTLAGIRKAAGLTQQQLGEELKISQTEVSKIERRTNLHLTTLARFVEATGGRLRLVADYGHGQVELEVAEITEQPGD